MQPHKKDPDTYWRDFLAFCRRHGFTDASGRVKAERATDLICGHAPKSDDEATFKKVLIPWFRRQWPYRGKPSNVEASQ
jgi:hypothetical protein